MSVIGLLDWDLTRWRQPTVFNIDLMKLAYYHKVHLHDIVQMEKKFNSEMCTKVFVQKDYEDFDYPKKIIEDPKVEWGGLARTNGIREPWPLEIEQSPADTSIYEIMKNYYNKNEQTRLTYRNLMSADHLRLTLDGVTPFDGWEKQLRASDGKTRHIIFHDPNMQAVKGLHDIIKDIGNEYGRKNVRVGFKFPLCISTEDELWDWGRFTKTPGVSNFNLMRLMPDKLIDQLTIYKQQFTYYIKSDFWTPQSFIEALPKILIQATFLSKHGITVLLKIDKNFIIDEMWHLYVQLFNDYIKTILSYRYSLVFCCFTYCKHCYNRLTTEEKIALFQFIKENNEELFNMLYGLEYAQLENGILVPHMYTSKQIFQKGGYGGYFYRIGHKREDKPEQFNYSEIIQPESVYLE
jgi:hypothetical protein